MQPLTAAQLSPDQHARILAITDPALARRLYDMGITLGCELYLLHIAPFGDPLVFRTPACTIALRRKDCRHIFVCL